MLNRFMLIACLLIFAIGLFSLDLEWGIKYGAGLSTIYGDNLNYPLQYNFTRVVNNVPQTENLYLMTKSNKQKPNLAQNAGIFFTMPLTSDKNTLLMQPEVIWQRYSYSYWFNGPEVMSNDMTIASLQADSLDGYITNTLDYVTVPLLFKLQQDKQETYEDNAAIISMYGYAGPSISFLLDNKSVLRSGIKVLDNTIQNFVANSMTDEDETTYYRYTKNVAGADEVIALKYDLVLGFGWNFKNVLKMGLGKDEWVLDFRFDLNLNPIGDAPAAKDFQLMSGIASIGYKF